MSAKELNDADLDQVQGGTKSKTPPAHTMLTTPTTPLGGQKPLKGSPLGGGNKPKP